MEFSFCLGLVGFAYGLIGLVIFEASCLIEFSFLVESLIRFFDFEDFRSRLMLFFKFIISFVVVHFLFDIYVTDYFVDLRVFEQLLMSIYLCY